MRALLLAVLVAAVPSSAQTADPVERLAQALSLTADQADLVAEVYDPADPSSTWTLAAELLPTLSADQREALMTWPERTDDARRQRQGGRRGRGTRQPNTAREAVMRAARDAALGLDDGQSARLDAAIEGMDRRDMAESLRNGEMPAAVGEVLTADQAELWRAQMTLQRRLRSRRGQGS